MSAQSIHDAFAVAEEHYATLVMKDTWGHLAPKKNKTYKGRIVYAVGCFGSDDLNPTPIVCEFDGLDGSPWFFDAINEFIQSQDNNPGCVYEFKGGFRNYHFTGTVSKVQDYNEEKAQ